MLWLELKKIRKPALTAMLGTTVLTCILTCTLYRGYSIYFRLDSWEIGTEYLGLLFPLLVTVPVCWQFYYERRNRFIVYTLPRISKIGYLTAKWLASALSAFLILFVPYFLSGLCALYAVNSTMWIPSENYIHVFHNLYTQTPLIYVLLLSLWKSFLGVLVMTFGFVLAMYGKNIFVILTVPFIYTVLENFGWSILGIPQFRFVTSFEPSCLSSNVVTVAYLAVGPLLLCVVIGVVALYYAKVKHRTVYEV